MTDATLLEVHDLCKRYPDFELRDLTFSLESGHITGFIGRNGAGKTTTIKCLLNLVHPTSGSIKYFGLPFEEHEAEIKQRIGYAPGAIDYYPKKKIGTILEVTRRFYPTWNDQACQRYLDRFALNPTKTPSELSEGMKVKFNLLLALSHDAELLILDEPTSGLDPFSRDEILETFKGLRDEGKALLFSTHITSDLEHCADDILYLRKGELVAASTIEDFKDRFGRPDETLEEIMVRLERQTLSRALQVKGIES